MFIDRARIHIKAGDGGKGCDSFYRDRAIRRGRPNGGGGGNGGSIVLIADAGIHTLLDFQYRRHFKGHKGTHGGSNNKRGQDGEDCVIKVPCGTVARDYATNAILRDLVTDGETVVIGRGGKGGRGNARNYTATTGDAGEAKEIILELKLIADVGIIGYPNAGKSTLISRISDAHPKIASYPFTTKAPVLGVVKIYDRSVVIADIPGLIEGAHKGRGLGDKFLRHVERTKLLLHLIDTAALDGKDPAEKYASLNKEIRLYNPSLADKPQIIVANKIDLPQAKENLAKLKLKVKDKVFPISAQTGEGVKELLSALGQRL